MPLCLPSYPSIFCRVSHGGAIRASPSSKPPPPPVLPVNLNSTPASSQACALECPHFQSYGLLIEKKKTILSISKFSSVQISSSLNLFLPGALGARKSSICTVRLLWTRLMLSLRAKEFQILVSIAVDWYSTFALLFYFAIWILFSVKWPLIPCFACIVGMEVPRETGCSWLLCNSPNWSVQGRHSWCGGHSSLQSSPSKH